LPPRWIIRTIWRAHRLLVRSTGARIGLPRFAVGRAGMLRLHTVGRRSGLERSVIVCYIEHGDDLVTLAMNGWGAAEPAWWRNLEARPDASVDLPGGRRRVRARAAVGDERVRLWRTLGTFSGWGDDLDAMAGLRGGTETTVVVLEPAAATSPA
jgi:deazaflavin-dependent oxidoreductase (nitroreductase family)